MATGRRPLLPFLARDRAAIRASGRHASFSRERDRGRCSPAGRGRGPYGLMFKDPGLWICAWAGRYRDDEAPSQRSCSKLCSNGADFADVRVRSPVSKSLVALRIRSLANGGEPAAQNWGSRGRRFKSCHPDGKQQVRGRFGQYPRRPLACRVAIGVATAHVLTSPLLLRTAERRSARPGWRRDRTRPR